MQWAKEGHSPRMIANTTNCQLISKMVVGLLSIVAIPTVTGVGQAVSAQKRQNAASKEREQFNITALFPDENGNLQEKGTCLLRDGKVRASSQPAQRTRLTRPR